MYDDFTDRARKAMACAYGAALRLHAELLEPEHILLGLAEWEHSGAAELLARIGVSLSGVRRELEARMSAGPAEPSGAGQLPFSARTQQVLATAIEDVDTLGDNAIGTEHLVLALASRPEGPALEVLRAFGAHRYRLLEVLETPRPLTPAALQAYAAAQRAAAELGHDCIETAHLLLALLEEDDGDLSAALADAGVDPEALRRAVSERLGQA